jgi:carbamoyltransferase
MGIVIGLGYTNHDMAATLIRDGRLVVHISRERLTRFRHDGGRLSAPHLPFAWDLSPCIEYCLSAARLSLSDVDLFVANNMPNLDQDGFNRDILGRSRLALDPRKVRLIPHHLAHAYSTYWSSGFTDSAVLVVDGQGNSLEAVQRYEGEDAQYVQRNIPGSVPRHLTEKISIYDVQAGRFRVVRKEFTHGSIGGAYLATTCALLGEGEPGKTMGLAPYGRKRGCAGELLSWHEGSVRYGYVSALPEYAAHAPVRRWPETHEWTDAHREAADLAALIQGDLEEVMIPLCRGLRSEVGAKQLCLAGGVTLNSVANRRVLKESGFDDVFIVPAAGDDGISLGCAQWGSSLLGEVRRQRMTSAASGRRYAEAQMEEAIGSDRRIRAERLSDRELVVRTARALSERKIVAWFQGRSEMGPRALGSRSILADPTDPLMKDVLNLRVKFREPYRPFAPVVTEAALGEFFDLDRASPFMLLVAPVREEKRPLLPAITHVDGTARVQTVSPEDGLLHQLLGSFAELAGVPVLLNTSLNIRGEPIVESPADAIRTFLNTRLDVLVMGNFYCLKEEPSDDELRASTLFLAEGTSFSTETRWAEDRWQATASVRLTHGRKVEVDEATLALAQRIAPSMPVRDLLAAPITATSPPDEAALLATIRRGLALNAFGIRLAPGAAA